MTIFTVQVNDRDVRASLQALAARINNLGPVLKEIGEDIVDDAKRRFETSTGPDGNRWAPNARSTIEALLAARSGSFAAFSSVKTRQQGFSRVGNKKGYFDQEGKLAKRGIDLVMSKKPLIGESGDLRRQISYHAAASMLTVTASPIYAAIQQFGGLKSEFPNLWGNIPARPFLPITQTGDLYPKDREKILATLNRYLAGN